MFLVSDCSCLCAIYLSQALIGDAPTTSEWSIILLPIKVRLILETWRVYIATQVMWTHPALHKINRVLCTFSPRYKHCDAGCLVCGNLLNAIRDSKILTHWDQDTMYAIFQTTFSNAFSWMKMFKFWLRFHWSLFPRFQFTIFQHWFRLWLGTDQATSHYLNQWWSVYWRIYASLGLNELRGQHGAHLGPMNFVIWDIIK